MLRAILLVSAFLGVLAADPPEDGFELVFADEFDQGKVDESVWLFRQTDLYRKGFNRRENVSVGTEDGVSCLKIRYDHEQVAGTPAFTCGGIITRKNFGYGYYETRCKLFSATTGLHSSFWTMGAVHADGSTRTSGFVELMEKGLLPFDNRLLEIDGYEHNSARDMDMGTVQYGTGYKRLRSGGRCNSGVKFGEWNVYGFDFAPGRLRFFVNGTVVHENTLPNPYGAANLWLTALAYSDCKDPAKLPGYSCWDYVRFYTKAYPGVNLLANGNLDFVRKGANPQWPIGWIEDVDREASLVVAGEGRGGTAALKQTATRLFSVTTKQDLGGIPDGLYDLTVWTKASSGSGTSVLAVRNPGGDERRAEIPRGGDWREVVLRGIPVRGHAATVAISTEGGPDTWLLVDDGVFSVQAAKP